MKKLLGISLIATLSVLPLMAMADPVTTPATATTQPANHDAAVSAGLVGATPYFSLIGTNNTTDNNAASAGYVKGAYNAAIKAVNAVHEEVASITSNALTTTGDGLSKDGNTVSVNVGDGLGIDVNNNLKVNASGGLTISSGNVVLNPDNSTIVVNPDNTVSVGTIRKSNIDPYDIRNATGDFSGRTNLATQGYVDEQVAENTNGMARQTGVEATISNTDLSVGEFTLTNGAVSGSVTIPMMQDWANPDTANPTGLVVSGNAIALSVGTAITEGSVTIDAGSVHYSEAFR